MERDIVPVKNIKVLMEEHDNILKAIGKAEQAAVELMNNPEADLTVFEKFIDFARNYADAHHHGKEEQILFRYMVANLGDTAKKLVNGGMLVEHDLGRLYVRNTDEALNNYRETGSDYHRLALIGSVFSYSELLRRHIDKENNVVYPFAQRELSIDTMKKVEDESDAFEKEHEDRRIFYSDFLK